MKGKICPLGLIARGGYGCFGDQCAWTDEKGKCLIYNILNNINGRIQPVQKIDITDYFDYFLKNVPIQSKEEK